MKEPTLKRNSNIELQSVFIIVNTFERGGAEMSLAILANELALKGMRVTFISLWKGQNSYNFDWISDNGVNVLELNESKNFIVSSSKLFKLFSSEKPNVVYSAMLYANFISQLCCYVLGINHISTVRINPSVFYKNNLFKRISFTLVMHLQSSIVFISHKALNDYLATSYGRLLGKKRFFVLHNPIAVKGKIDNDYLEEKINLTKTKIKNLVVAPESGCNTLEVLNFVIVSRLVEGKGIMETLEQIKIPFRKHRFHLSIFGVGPIENTIREFIDRESLHDQIALKGFSSDIDKIFSDSDILIFPSRSEGFGRVPFEGMLRGNLVLCNKSVSIVKEFLNIPMGWIDFSEPIDLLYCVGAFSEIDPIVCREQVNRLSSALSPSMHALEFEKIASVSLKNCQ